MIVMVEVSVIAVGNLSLIEKKKLVECTTIRIKLEIFHGHWSSLSFIVIEEWRKMKLKVTVLIDKSHIIKS